MYYSKIEDDIIEKLENYIKWFLFSKDEKYEVTKTRIGMDRLYQLNYLSKFEIKDVRNLWIALKLKFLISSITTENTFKSVISFKCPNELIGYHIIYWIT